MMAATASVFLVVSEESYGEAARGVFTTFDKAHAYAEKLSEEANLDYRVYETVIDNPKFERIRADSSFVYDENGKAVIAAVSPPTQTQPQIQKK